MSATNHTANYSLSQYIGSDEPKYLTDYNSDMSKIDAAIKGAETKADTANTGVAANTSAIGSLDTAVSSLQTQVATVAEVANGNTGSINTINSLIGTGEPTTSDKTIIGAINEIAAEIVDPSGLEARIGAVEDEIGNTALPTTAQTLTGAIAELAQGGSTGGADLNFVNNADATLTAGTGVTIDTGSSSIQLLSNADKTIGKVYGGFACTTASADANNWHTLATIAINTSVIPTISTAYNINYGFAFIKDSSNVLSIRPIRLHFNTDGSIEIQMYNIRANDTVFINLAPCVLVLQNLGD